MRRISFVEAVASGLILLILITTPSAAEELWYQAYENAEKAIAAKDWTTAEQKLLAAKKNGPKQGKRVRTYGMNWIKFIPDYQLGFVYANLQKTDLARQQFELVKSSGLVTPSDPEYEIMAKFLGPSASGEAAKPIASEDVAKLIKSAEEALRAGRLDAARKDLAAAKDRDPANPAIARLDAQIKKPQEVLQYLVDASKLIDQMRLDGARKSLRAAVERDPSNRKIKELEDRLLSKENELRQVVRNANALQEVQSAKKGLQGYAEQEPGNSLFQQLMTELNLREAEIKTKNDKALREQRLGEFAHLMTKATQAFATKDYAQARRFAVEAKATGVDDKKTAADLIQQISVAEYQDLLFQANQKFNSKNYDGARELAQNASKTGADKAGQAKNLLRKIDVEQAIVCFESAKAKNDVPGAQQCSSVIASKDPGNPRLREMSEWISRGVSDLNTEQKEQLALLSYYRGMYEDANRLLLQVEQEKKKSAQVYFYLGCSQSAIALMKSKDERQQLLRKAEQFFVQVRVLDPNFRFDERFISPRILKIYEQVR